SASVSAAQIAMYRVVASRAFRAGAPQKAFGCWCNLSRSAHTLPFATLEADEISGSKPGEVYNLG
ncbi:hypothetical protein CISIN_1g045599mg, partial [Citrus sinensis]